jgi:AcrR family transcriptional regulator
MISVAPVPPEQAQCRKGRPRDERIDRDITASALSVLSDNGFERFSVEEVAVRAGVAKTTVYRRFPTRTDLIVGALERLNDDLPPPPPPGPVRDRLVAVLSAVRSRATTSVRGRILMQVSVENLRDPALVELVDRRVMSPRRQLLRDIVAEGIRSGELDPGIDSAAVIPLLVGPMLYLGMWSTSSVARGVSVEAIVDLALSGLTRASDS